MSSKLFSEGWIDVSKIRLDEANTIVTAGEYNGPQEIGLRKWTDSELAGFTITSDNPLNKLNIKKQVKGNVLKTIGGWEPGSNNFEVPTYDVDAKHEIKTDSNGVADMDPMVWYKEFKSKKILKTSPKKVKTGAKKTKTIKEDLGVWFGTKKKPKGSKQPKGPWVNICRKKEGGGHPPCGRPDTDKGAYPKCRAAGVAAKMSDSAKRAACQQKRKAEKKDTQTGKGQKPIMTSYKPKNESIMMSEIEMTKLVKTVLNEQLNLKRKKGPIVLLCGTGNEIELPSQMICKRPTETGQRQNNAVIVGCDKLNNPVVVGGNTNVSDIEYDCGVKKITAYGGESYKNIPNVAKQKELDSQWLSKFCYLIKESPRRFKSCSSKVSI